jgi:hypothetical protein
MARGFSVHAVGRVAELKKTVDAAHLILTIAQEEGDTEVPADQMEMLTALNEMTQGGYTASIVALMIRYINLDEQVKAIEGAAGRLSAIMSYMSVKHGLPCSCCRQGAAPGCFLLSGSQFRWDDLVVAERPRPVVAMVAGSQQGVRVSCVGRR